MVRGVVVRGSAVWVSYGVGSHSALELQCMGSEEHTSELQSQFRISYAVFCLKKKKKKRKEKEKEEEEEKTAATMQS